MEIYALVHYIEREFGNFVDLHAIAIKKDSIDDVASRFENSFISYPACYVLKYSKYQDSQ